MKKLWWSSVHDDVKHCFVCGGGLALQFVPADKKKRLVCRACRHITYLNPKSVAGLIPVRADGRIALLRRNIEPGLGKWSYPAGYQEIGESVGDAAVRETQEEICARTRITKLLGVYSYPDSGIVTVVYVGRLLGGERPRPGVEAQEVKFFSRNNLPWTDLAFRSTIDALKDWATSR